jgi:hypothetical protein
MGKEEGEGGVKRGRREGRGGYRGGGRNLFFAETRRKDERAKDSFFDRRTLVDIIYSYCDYI